MKGKYTAVLAVTMAAVMLGGCSSKPSYSSNTPKTEDTMKNTETNASEWSEEASEVSMHSILLTWDPNAEDMLDGKFTLDYYISGTDSDGNDFIWQQDQSEYYKADGSLAGKKTYAEGQVLLELYDMQSNYYLSVGPVEFPTNAWIESVEVSVLDANQNKQPLGDKYLYRGQTGFWGYDFEIHQGVIQ